MTLRSALIGAHVKADVNRAHDRRRIAAAFGTPRIQHLALALPFGRREIRRVPAVGESRRRPQCSFLSRASDPERESCLDRLRVVRRIDEPEMRAVEVGATTIEQESQGLRVFLELILAPRDGRKRDAVGGELDLVPPRADSAIGAPSREVVDGAERLRQDTRVPVPDAEDEAADAHSSRLHRRRGQRRDGFETVPVPTLRWRLLKVVGDRKPVESALVGEPPEPAHFIERTAEVTEMYPEPSTRNPSMGRPTASVTSPACSSRGPGSPPTESLRHCPRCRTPPARDHRRETPERERAPSSCSKTSC